MSSDRYGPDPLANRRRREVPQVPAERGLVVEDVTSGWVGAVVRVEKSGGQHLVELEDRRGRTRSFTLGGGFWIDGQAVVLVPPQRPGTPRAPQRTASGSRAVPDAPARVARASRIWVEGRHDAELVEKVWGDDLRVEGVVVELLDGADNLPEAVRAFAPDPGRRLGVLVDHLVPGSKESRLADEAVRAAPPGTVLVLGHPWVDVWQTVRPQRLGMEAWPVVPRGTEWKVGVLAAMGWPHSTQAEIANAWARILGTVRTYADLDPALLGRVEELIDFVTA
ncbi:MAG: DUF3097 domain-containing protein [Micrococcales bacterium]|nr:DUF3097 domain-containing protein [Micrococcales bacterium]